MAVIQKIFPKYTSAVVQMQHHGTDAYKFVRAAASSPDAPARLDNAVRAYNSFDHAVTSSKSLPLSRVIPTVGKYYVGYQAAKTVAELIVGSGLVPGAAERVGRQEILAAREEFHTGVASYGADPKTRFGRYQTADWMRSSTEDAVNGVLMLRRADIARPLIDGLDQTRRTMERRRALDPALIQKVDNLFQQAGSLFDDAIASAERAALNSAPATPAAPVAP